jgi:cobalt/nickel transport system permease protein/energy-coupling factor transport system permease protein
MFGPYYMAATVIICLAIAGRAGKLRGFWKLWSKSILVLSLAILVLQMFFVPGETGLFSWWLFEATQEGLDAGITIASRVLGVGAAVILLIQIMNPQSLVLDLERRGINPRATYVLTATVNIIPQMGKQMGVIMDAQRSRGVETDANLWVRMQAFVPTLGPLILNSIMSVEEKALTLESRGFSATGKRTSLYSVEDSPADRRLRIALYLAFALAVAVRIILWML